MVKVIEFDEKYLNDVVDMYYELNRHECSLDKSVKLLSKDEIRKLLNKWLKSKNFHIFLAIEDKPVGFVSIRIYSPKTLVYEKIIEVTDIFVLEEYRGKGIGKLLMNKVEEFAKQNNIKFIFLEVFRDNPAFNFYKKLGYEIWLYKMKKII